MSKMLFRLHVILELVESLQSTMHAQYGNCFTWLIANQTKVDFAEEHCISELCANIATRSAPTWWTLNQNMLYSTLNSTSSRSHDKLPQDNFVPNINSSKIF